MHHPALNNNTKDGQDGSGPDAIVLQAIVAAAGYLPRLSSRLMTTALTGSDGA